MEPITNPDTSGEAFWLLLSLTALPPEEAITRFALETPARDDPRCMRSSSNPLQQLCMALTQYDGGWEENFEGECETSRRLVAHCLGMAQEYLASPPGPQCREEFVAGQSWQTARKLARKSLDEAGMPHVPLTGKVDFGEYIEMPHDV